MRSKFLQEILDEMEKDPWYVKFKRWFRLKLWVITCKLRYHWNKIFKRK